MIAHLYRLRRHSDEAQRAQYEIDQLILRRRHTNKNYK